MVLISKKYSLTIFFFYIKCIYGQHCPQCQCECSYPYEISLRNYFYKHSFYPTGCINYCIPLNCSWRVVSNFSDPNIYLTYYFNPLSFRKNSNDVIRVGLDNESSRQNYNYTNNALFTTPVNINQIDGFSINFNTNEPVINATSLICNAGWNLYVTANYKSCDCSTPSTLYFYDPSNVYTISSTVNINDGGSYYCAPMQCSWSIINYLDNFSVNISGSVSLRKNSGDYIQALSYFSYVLFKLDYTYNSESFQTDSIMAPEFTINFVTDDNSTIEPGIFPHWSLTLSLIPNDNSISSTTSTVTHAPPCSCYAPYYVYLSENHPLVNIIPPNRHCGCYPIRMQWRVYNNWTNHNTFINIGFNRIALKDFNDFLEILIPDNILIFNYTFHNNCGVGQQQDYFFQQLTPCPFNFFVLNASVFHINFYTQYVEKNDNNRMDRTDTLRDDFQLDLTPTFQTCDCSPPSTNFINDLSMTINLFPAGYSNQYYSYCAPIDCTWKFINGFFGLKSIQIVPTIFSLRNTTEDYIEGRFDDGTIIFHLDGTSNVTLNTTFYVDAPNFQIIFHASANVPSQIGALPYWNLQFKTSNYNVSLIFPTPNSNPLNDPTTQNPIPKMASKVYENLVVYGILLYILCLFRM